MSHKIIIHSSTDGPGAVSVDASYTPPHDEPEHVTLAKIGKLMKRVRQMVHKLSDASVEPETPEN